jgi:hypothetical protein
MRTFFANLVTSFVIVSASTDQIVEDYRLVSSNLAHKGLSTYPNEHSTMDQISDHFLSVHNNLGVAHGAALDQLEKVCIEARTVIDSINKTPLDRLAERRE